MIRNMENIYRFILSEIATKVIGLLLAFLIIFNCVFSPVLTNITTSDLSAFSDIQKDVFSAVFFVANKIEKINFSLTSKIVSDNTAKQSSSNNEENKALPCKSNDFIITGSQIQNESMKLQYSQNGSVVAYNVLLYDYGSLSTDFYVFCNKIFCFSSIIFLFYASIKKLYDNIVNSNINRINPAFMHI